MEHCVSLLTLSLNPCGSSTGSAVGVAAGYSPISIGTETSGSIVSPATRAGLFALKPTVGTSSTDGVWTLSVALDSVGGMSRSVVDLAELTQIIQSDDDLTNKAYRDCLTGDFKGLKIGFLDPSIWRFPEQVCKTTPEIVDQMAGPA